MLGFFTELVWKRNDFQDTIDYCARKILIKA